jgi:hypothetical protein
MKNYFKFRDTVDFKTIEVAEQKSIKDNLLAQGPNKPLIVKIAASHAGLITRNNGFYLPDKMRQGASSFTAQYNKPIQIHHNDDKDPVGRVLKAQYVPINSAELKIQQKFAKDTWSNFSTGKMNFISSINFICDTLNSSDSVLDDPNYQGAGYLELTASIADPDAIQKVLDGRYLTGSVGLTTDAAVCSICKQDWVDTAHDERCEHRPGKVYDGKKAFVITGNLNYDEYSFVNTPADRHSRVMEINVNGMTDRLEMSDSVGKAIAVNIITDNIQEDNMKSVATKLISDSRFSILGKEYLDTLLASLEDEKTMEKWPFTDELDFTVNFELDLDKQSIDKAFELKEDQIAAIKLIRPFMTDETIKSVLDAKPADAAALYTALNDGEWADYAESEDEDLNTFRKDKPSAELVEYDSKLSTAARKRLPGSSFCGPNKSFPVPDCAHVTAARRLIGRASASSATKSKILACVSRKSTAMNCGGKKDAKEEIDSTKDKKEEDCACKDADAKIIELTAKIETLTISNTTLQTAADEFQNVLQARDKAAEQLQKDLTATREELKVTQDDLTGMSDQLIESKSLSTTYLVDKLVTFKLLSGEVIEDSKKVSDELTALGEEEIKNKLTEITGKVDIKKITDSINSGLTRLPNKSAIDPTMTTTPKIYDKAIVAQIEQEFMRIKFGGLSPYGKGPDGAERFKVDMQNKGLLPIG